MLLQYLLVFGSILKQIKFTIIARAGKVNQHAKIIRKQVSYKEMSIWLILGGKRRLRYQIDACGKIFCIPLSLR